MKKRNAECVVLGNDHRKSRVGCKSPDRFGTKGNGEAHGLDEGRITPSSSVWLNSAFAPFNFSAGMQRGRENTGAPVVSTWCLME